MLTSSFMFPVFVTNVSFVAIPLTGDLFITIFFSGLLDGGAGGGMGSGLGGGAGSGAGAGIGVGAGAGTYTPYIIYYLTKLHWCTLPAPCLFWKPITASSTF